MSELIKTALVTGASSGIGREIALHLARSGHKLIITSSQAESLSKVKNEIEKYDTEVLAVTGNAIKIEDIQNIVNTGLECFGAIDILINNVGFVGRIVPFMELVDSDWLDLFILNVMSGVRFSKACLPAMQKNKWGRIIFISSEKAIAPGTRMSHYAMTKAAILAVAKSLANEVGVHNITVNSIAPGVILTPSWNDEAMEAGMKVEDYARQFSPDVLTQQPIGKPQDVAALVNFLCSEEARWITGTCMRVDGGSIKSV